MRAICTVCGKIAYQNPKMVWSIVALFQLVLLSVGYCSCIAFITLNVVKDLSFQISIE